MFGADTRYDAMLLHVYIQKTSTWRAGRTKRTVSVCGVLCVVARMQSTYRLLGEDGCQSSYQCLDELALSGWYWSGDSISIDSPWLICGG